MTILTVIGFLFTTLCASICPMNMTAMPVDMGSMQMAAADMDMGMDAKVPCKRCSQQQESVALSAPAVDVQVAALIATLEPFTVFSYPNALKIRSVRLPLASTGPPPLSESLVGTVILRT